MKRTPVRIGRHWFYLDDVAYIDFGEEVGQWEREPPAKVYLRWSNGLSFEIRAWEGKQIAAALQEWLAAEQPTNG